MKEKEPFRSEPNSKNQGDFDLDIEINFDKKQFDNKTTFQNSVRENDGLQDDLKIKTGYKIKIDWGMILKIFLGLLIGLILSKIIIFVIDRVASIDINWSIILKWAFIISYSLLIVYLISLYIGYLIRFKENKKLWIKKSTIFEQIIQPYFLTDFNTLIERRKVKFKWATDQESSIYTVTFEIKKNTKVDLENHFKFIENIQNNSNEPISKMHTNSLLKKKTSVTIEKDKINYDSMEYTWCINCYKKYDLLIFDLNPYFKSI